MNRVITGLYWVLVVAAAVAAIATAFFSQDFLKWLVGAAIILGAFAALLAYGQKK